MRGSEAATANIFISCLVMSFKLLRLKPETTAAIVAAIALFVQPGLTQRPVFYPDDPIAIDDDTALDASKVAPVEDSNGYDFVANTFAKPGVRHDVRAGNVNTIDEVPDSSWFANRIGRARMSTEEIVRGPDRLKTISLDGWK